MGTLLDRDWSHGRVMGLLASAQIVVVVIVLVWYPETAHRELEDLNPEDRPPAHPSDRGGAPRANAPDARKRSIWHPEWTATGLSCPRRAQGSLSAAHGGSVAVRPGVRARDPTNRRADVAAPRAWRQRGSIAARSRRWLAGLRTEGRRVGRPVAVDRRRGAGPRRWACSSPDPSSPRTRGHPRCARSPWRSRRAPSPT